MYSCDAMNIRGETAFKGKVIVYKKGNLPLAYVKLLFKGGNALENKAGELYLLGRILSQSNLSLSLEEFGTTLSVNTDYESFSLDYELLSSLLEPSLKQVFHFLKNYKISKQEFQFAKYRLLQELKLQKDQYYHQARFYFYENLYGKTHRYGRPITGIFASVKQITIEDLQKLYDKAVNKALAHLILVGNIKDSDKYSSYLNELPNKTISYSKDRKISKPLHTGKRIYNIASSQVFVRIGSMGIKRSNKNYVAYKLLSDLIGGGFGSIVMKKLREEKGLTYSPVANFYSQRIQKGYFFVAYSTRVKNLGKSLQVIDDVFKQLAENGISKAGFKLSLKALYGNLIQRQETNSGIASLLEEALVFNLKPMFWEENLKQLKELNYEKVSKLAKHFFNGKKFTYIILRPPK